MNLILFCVLFCSPTSLAFELFFHKVNPKYSEYDEIPSLACTVHNFYYYRGDKITVNIKLKNSSNVTNAFAVVRTNLDIKGVRFQLHKEKTIYFNTFLIVEEIRFDIELITKDGCLRQRILVGRVMTATNLRMSNKYNDICIKENQCVAVVSEAKRCLGLTTQPCELTSNPRPQFTTAAPRDRHHESSNETYELLDMLNTTVLAAISMLTPQNRLSTTTSTGNTSGAETSYFTVMIVASVTATIALVLLLVIAVRHFCRKKGNASALLQIGPMNENRYYENIVFRDGCQQQIEELEQRAAEDLCTSELQYEQINNCRNR